MLTTTLLLGLVVAINFFFDHSFSGGVGWKNPYNVDIPDTAMNKVEDGNTCSLSRQDFFLLPN